MSEIKYKNHFQNEWFKNPKYKLGKESSEKTKTHFEFQESHFESVNMAIIYQTFIVQLENTASYYTVFQQRIKNML